MKRTLALILALVLALPVLVACGGGEKAPEQTTAAAADTATEPASTEPETTALHDDVPELNYNGATIPFYIRTNTATEFYSEELNGEVVNDAIFERNSSVQERLNVKLDFSAGAKGDYASRATYSEAVTQSVLAGAAAWDVVTAYSMAGANLAFAKVLRNMNDSKYINLDKPWWPDSLIQETMVNGFLPFVSGDISIEMIKNLTGIFFNKALIEDYKLANPYDMVREGKWTVDNMFTMVKGTYVDVNGDGKKDKDDKFGFITNHVWNDAFYWGCGLVTVEKDQAGKLVLSPQYSSEKTHELIVKLCNYFYTGNDNLFVPDDSAYLYDIFKEQRSVFIQTVVSNVISKYRDAEFEIGILPNPKYDEDQKNYITNMSFGYTLYCVTIDVNDERAERAGAVLECLASQGYFLASPALFETALKVKYASDPDSAEMYDIIRVGASFDIGRVFTASFGNLTYSMFRNAVKNNSTDWASTFASNKEKLESTLVQLNDAYNVK